MPDLTDAPGVTPPPEGPRHPLLSDSLIARGLVTESEMNDVLGAVRTGGAYGHELVERGSITEDDLARTLAAHHQLPHVDLDRFPVDREAVGLLDADAVRRVGGVPVAELDDGSVAVAVHHPDTVLDPAELEAALARPVTLLVAARSQVEEIIAPGARMAELTRRVTRAETQVVEGTVERAVLRRRLAQAEREAEAAVREAREAADAQARAEDSAVQRARELASVMDELARERAERERLDAVVKRVAQGTLPEELPSIAPPPPPPPPAEPRRGGLLRRLA